MRVLHVISDKNIGGAGILLLNLLRSFDRTAVKSWVALPYGSRLRERILELDVPVVELRHACDRLSAPAVWEIIQVIRATNPQIVHANAAISARLAGRLCKKTVFYTRHCVFPEESGFAPVRLLRNLSNNVLCDCAVATAKAAVADLRATGISQAKICVIPNGSQEVREVDEAEKALCRAQYHILPSDFCVGICARLEPCKGHEVFLRAAKLASMAMPEVPFRFLIVGEGSRRAGLERLAKKLGISEKTVFTGFVRDVAPLYRIMQVQVNCSVGTETSCLAISEGMSAGLPTILSDYGGNREMLGQSGAGYCLPQGNAPALAEALCRLAAQPELRAAMAKKARERYLQKYTAESMASKLTAVYQNVLNQKFESSREATAK